MKITITTEFNETDKQLVIAALIEWVEFLQENDISAAYLIEPNDADPEPPVVIRLADSQPPPAHP
jgi:hypothetical protein